MKPSMLRFAIGILIGLHIGFCRGENVSVYYRASGVILNHNFTKEFFTKNCEPCRILADDIKAGNAFKNVVTKHYAIFLSITFSFQFWKMFDFFVQFNLFGDSMLLNKTSKGIFFRLPSLGEPDINATEKEVLQPDENKEESGVYFIMVMRVEVNMTDPSKDFPVLKERIRNACWQYLRLVVHFQLLSTVWLNKTGFVFKELSETQVTNYLDLLKTKHNFESKILLRKSDDIPESHQNALSIISYVGCTLSILGLFFTILTITLSRKLRRLRQNQILAYLCVSLLAAILLFTFGINGMTGSDSLDVCKAMAALLHYFLLSSIVWMSIEAYNMYQDLVKVFDTTFISQNEFMCRAGVVGWIIPAMIVVITVLAEPQSYGFHVMDKNNETLCWMDADAFYGAFLAPVLLLMAVNAFIFLAVMKEIYNIPHMCEKNNRLSHFRATVSVFFLLGLNWLFAGLAATVGTLVFHYLFTITCSFQGFVIFLLHGILKKDFQEAWHVLTAKNRVMEMIRSSSFATPMSKTVSVSSQSTTFGVKERANPITLNGSTVGESGIQIQVNTSVIISS